MRLKLLACDVFTREVCACVARSPHVYDIDFTELGAHENSAWLRSLIQEKIDRVDAEKKAYDAILLLYGLCGNATADVVARSTRLVIPRAHDCCTIFLGSKAAFRKHFGDNPSRPFTSAGYWERSPGHMREEEAIVSGGMRYSYAEYVATYGEENAQYLWDTLKGTAAHADAALAYIETPPTRTLHSPQELSAWASSKGKTVEVLHGSDRLIKGLLRGPWPQRDFCVVPPGERIEGLYDWDTVLQSVRRAEPPPAAPQAIVN